MPITCLVLSQSGRPSSLLTNLLVVPLVRVCTRASQLRSLARHTPSGVCQSGLYLGRSSFPSSEISFRVPRQLGFERCFFRRCAAPPLPTEHDVMCECDGLSQ